MSFLHCLKNGELFLPKITILVGTLRERTTKGAEGGLFGEERFFGVGWWVAFLRRFGGGTFDVLGRPFIIL